MCRIIFQDLFEEKCRRLKYQSGFLLVWADFVSIRRRLSVPLETRTHYVYEVIR